jgi:FkbM family methyltransferase
MNSTAHMFKRPSWLAAVLHLLGRCFELRATIGLVNTLKLYLGHRFARHYTLQVPFLTMPLHLRGRTSDSHVFRKVFISEEYHVPNLRPRLIIDAGANIGISAVYFAALYPEAIILCLEPESSNIQQFRRNTSNYPNIRLLPGALWSRNALLSITNPNADSVSFVVKECGPASQCPDPVEGYGIRELLAEVGHDRIDILKIDIEGSEAEVFGAAPAEWLSRVGVLLIELHENKAPGCGRIFFDATAKHPFQYHQQGENVVLVHEGLVPV